MTPALLEADGLVMRYGGVTATDHVSLRLDRSELLGGIGPNGAVRHTHVGLLVVARASKGGRHYSGSGDG